MFEFFFICFINIYYALNTKAMLEPLQKPGVQIEYQIRCCFHDEIGFNPWNLAKNPGAQQAEK